MAKKARASSRRKTARKKLPGTDELRDIMQAVLRGHNALSVETAIWYFLLVDETLAVLKTRGFTFNDDQLDRVIGEIRALVNGRDFQTTLDGKVYL